VSESESRPVGSRAWLELLHAEACWLLGAAGIDVIVLKGPATARWLYPEGGRQSVDVDLLVDPAQWVRAGDVLGEHGFEPVQEGFREGEAAPHSVELQRHDPVQGDHVVDLHRYFPGIEVAPEDAFAILWARRMPEVIARVPVAFPDVTTRALVVALHAARTPGNPRTGDDLLQAVQAMDLNGWADVASLAADLDALPALRAGLETQPEATRLVAPLGLSDIEVPAHWRLMSTDADQTAVRLDQLSGLPPAKRVGQVLRWAFPSRSFVRDGDPRAERGPAGLAVAYGARLVDGVRRFPAAYRQYRSSRR